jgi:hypothetical protein
MPTIVFRNMAIMRVSTRTKANSTPGGNPKIPARFRVSNPVETKKPIYAPTINTSPWAKLKSISTP